jgi:hypothetical protein
MKISKLDGGSISLDLMFLAETEVGKALDKFCRAITAELRYRRDIQSGKVQSERSSSGLEPNDWFKSACYELIVMLREEHHENLLEDRIETYNKGKRGRKLTTDFQKGLKGILAHEQREPGNPDSELVGRRDRERFGKQMDYAYRHKVPPAFLRCFTMTYGRRAIRAGHQDKYIEPELAEWAAHRFIEQDEWREFPDEMYDLIDKLRRVRELRSNIEDQQSDEKRKKKKRDRRGSWE